MKSPHRSVVSEAAPLLTNRRGRAAALVLSFSQMRKLQLREVPGLARMAR